MAVATSTLLGRPVWYELMTSDMKSAENFYTAVVCWKTVTFYGAGQSYMIFNRAGNNLGNRRHLRLAHAARGQRRGAQAYAGSH